MDLKKQNGIWSFQKKAGSIFKPGGVFKATLYDRFGNLKWKDHGDNIVVTEAQQHILDVLFISATTQVDPWYMGITDGAPTVALSDTMGSHVGWTEVTAYTEGTRPEYVDSRTDQTVSNSASKATYSINTNGTTIGGAFIVSDNTKGGTTGTLLCVSAFDGGNKTGDSGDTLEVQYDFGAADDGV